MMKSARPESERAPRATNPTSRPRRYPSTTSDFQSGMTKLGHILVKILTFPVQILHWLTHPPGSSIMLGLAVLYFALLNTEGYWQAMPGMHPSFLPKPFVDDAADLRNLLFALTDYSFYLATVVSLSIQAVQAKVIREISAERAKAEYEAVAHYEVPEPNERGLDLAELRRQRFKRVGMRAARQMGLTILLVYAIDISVGFSNYPLLSLATVGLVAINGVWLILSVVGCELAINMYLDAREQANDAKRPQVEVV